MASTANAPQSSNQLLIVGPGVLGSCLGKLWLDQHGPGSVTGQTNTTTNHSTLQALGITPRTKDQASQQKFPYVAFCAPPSGSDDYPAELKAALDLWDGTGSFVFTSSAAVYALNDGECVDDSPTVPLGANERTDRLVAAEQAVLAAGGNVVRLVGLYHKTRGAHTFFLKQGEVARWGGAIINLIHYEDAAGLAYAVLSGSGNADNAPYRGRAFLGCDDQPTTFQDMMDVIAESGVLPGKVTFTGPAGPSQGKRTKNEATRQQLQWQPKYKNIGEFFKGSGKGEDWYSMSSSGAVPTGAPHA